jgi:hypothetical protein
MRKPAKRRRRIACAPPPCGSELALLHAARENGLLDDKEYRLRLALLLRRAGLTSITKAPR